MMDDSIIYARIARSANFNSAVDFLKYPPDLPRIKRLDDKDILFSLYRDEECWTAVSRENLYFQAKGKSGQIDIKEVGLIIHDYLFGLNSKGAPSEFLDIDEDRVIWVVDAATRCGLENIILMLEK